MTKNNDIQHLEKYFNSIDWANEWQDVRFYDEIIIFDYIRNRSGIKFIAYSLRYNFKYYIFVSDFLKMFNAGLIDGNKIYGNFKVSKKGTSFGVSLANIDEADSNEEIELPFSKIEYRAVIPTIINGNGPYY